jgi:hypothetical protein
MEINAHNVKKINSTTLHSKVVSAARQGCPLTSSQDHASALNKLTGTVINVSLATFLNILTLNHLNVNLVLKTKYTTCFYSTAHNALHKFLFSMVQSAWRAQILLPTTVYQGNA